MSDVTLPAVGSEWLPKDKAVREPWRVTHVDSPLVILKPVWDIEEAAARGEESMTMWLCSIALFRDTFDEKGPPS